LTYLSTQIASTLACKSVLDWLSTATSQLSGLVFESGPSARLE